MVCWAARPLLKPAAILSRRIRPLRSFGACPARSPWPACVRRCFRLPKSAATSQRRFYKMRVQDFDVYKNLLYQRSGYVITTDKSYLLESRLAPVIKKHNIESMEGLTN